MFYLCSRSQAPEPKLLTNILFVNEMEEKGDGIWISLTVPTG